MLRTYRWMLYGVVALSFLGWATRAPGGSPPGLRSFPAQRPEATTRPAVQRLMGALGIGGRMTSTAPARPDLDEDDPAGDGSNAAEPDIHVSMRGTVEMHVTELDLASVLQILGQQSQRNIIASAKVAGKVTANLYGVTIEDALEAILAANNCVAIPKGDYLLVYTNEELAKEDAKYACTPRVFRLRYIDPNDALAALEPIVGKDGIKITRSMQESGGSSGNKATTSGQGAIDIGVNSTAAGHDASLLVYASEDKLKKVAAVLEQIDKRPKQVLIESTILRAQLTEDNALGVDFNIVGGVNFEMLNSTSPGITSIETGDLPQPQMRNTSMTFQTDFNNGVPPGGFSFGIIKDSVAVFLRALEQVTDTSVIANPKVLALNGQPAGIMVGRRDGYLTTTVTETTSTQTVQFLDTGTLLVFRAYVGDDDYIRMSIHPKDSTGGLTASNLPFEQTTEVMTDIGVRDGYTILIGGLFREVTSASRSQMPYLGSLPVAGALFRNTRDSTQREEVIILLTVHIVKDDDALVEASRKAAEDVERYRVGMREGLQVFGRERLAQAHYRWAVEHLEHGDEGRALWDARIAVYLNPGFLAAIALTEKLSNKRAWDEDGSAIRDFVVREIQREKGVNVPLYGRPGPPFVVPEHLEGPNGFGDAEEGTPKVPASRKAESEASS